MIDKFQTHRKNNFSAFMALRNEKNLEKEKSVEKNDGQFLLLKKRMEGFEGQNKNLKHQVTMLTEEKNALQRVSLKFL